jgi:GAF domain-containing protein
MMCVPLRVAARTIAMLNVYRYGEDVRFSAYEALIIERFGIIVALALDSARQRELLRTQADTDELTGLLNRRAFNHRLDVLLHRARLTPAPLRPASRGSACSEVPTRIRRHTHGRSMPTATRSVPRA